MIKDLTPATLRIMLKFNNLCDAKNGFLCDYLGYDWDVKQVKNDENNSVNLFDITLKKKK